MAISRALLDVFDAGVLICDRDGRVVMHNVRVLRLLGVEAVETAEGSGDGSSASALAGQLEGQSIFAWIDERLLTDAFDEVEREAAAGARAPRAVFATALNPERLLRVKVRQVPVPAERPARFVVHLRPMEPWSQAEATRHRMLQELAEGLRDPLASVRAAIETVTEYPDMEEAVAAQFKQIILEQTVALSERLDEAIDAYARFYRDRWPLDEMSARDLLVLLHVRLDSELAVPVEAQFAERQHDGQRLLRVRVDTYALTEAVLFLARRIVNAAQCDRLMLHLQPVRRFMALDLMWEGGTVSRERLEKWEDETLHLGDTIISMTLREIVDRHDAEIWTQEGEDGQAMRIRLMLPAQ